MRPQSTKVMAVIHYQDDAQAMRNASVAFEAGATGVFLIDMAGRDDMISAPAYMVKQAFPNLVVGTNRLVQSAADSITGDAALGLDANWQDNPGVYSSVVEPVASEIKVAFDTARQLRPDFLFFGSVAFKTQKQEVDPAKAALWSARFGWVTTTSGPATGVAPDVNKLRLMKEAIGAAPLAVASGVTPENVAELAPYLDWILVATGVSRDFHNLDLHRLEAVVQQARGR